MRKYSFYLTLLVMPCALFLSGCGTIGVENISKEEWLEDRLASSLTSYSLSQDTINTLEVTGLFDLYKQNQDAGILELKKLFDSTGNTSYAAALAEMCYLQGKEDSSVKYYLSSLIFAYQFFALKDNKTLDLSPQNYFITRYFNFSLMEIFSYLKEHNMLTIKEYRLPSVYGNIAFRGSNYEILLKQISHDSLIPIYQLRPYGLRCYTYQTGLGLPLAGKINFVEKVKKGQDIILNPVTLMIKLEIKDNIPKNATLEYINPLKTKSTIINGKEFPLQTDFTTPMAEALENPPLIQGIRFMFFPDEILKDGGLYMAYEYDPTKIPVVFVHGLMSNPRTWIKAFNNLINDPVIRKHYQFWFFGYATGDPVLYSASLLRKALLNMQQKYSKKGDDTQFNRMVLVSHSMGGIVSSLQVKESEQQLVDNLIGMPIDQLDLQPEQKEFLIDMLVFKRLPFVQRVLFISTPHRGSYLAAYDIVTEACKYIALPTRLTGLMAKVGHKLLVKMKLKNSDDVIFMSTGVNNLDPHNKTLTLVESLPYHPAVKYHTLSGDIEDDSPLPGATDGIVPYWSSHLDNVESEKVVTSGHSVQDTNAGIKEIHRILLEHLTQYGFN